MQDTAQITTAREVATLASRARENAAYHFARTVAEVAALIIRHQFPTSATVIFAQDETVHGETTIEIIKVTDARGEGLGDLDVHHLNDAVQQLIIAYDAAEGFFDLADQDSFDRLGAGYEDMNNLYLYLYHLPDAPGEIEDKRE